MSLVDELRALGATGNTLYCGALIDRMNGVGHEHPGLDHQHCRFVGRYTGVVTLRLCDCPPFRVERAWSCEIEQEARRACRCGAYDRGF